MNILFLRQCVGQGVVPILAALGSICGASRHTTEQ
jgi:hypothetical protein